MKPKNIIITGSVFAATAVAIGAFGAHGLKELLIANGRQDVFETAVKYQFYHALAIMILGVLIKIEKQKGMTASFKCFCVGILIFSGSLYTLAVTNISILGAITPIGGVLFLIGWGLLIRGLLQTKI